ncbi:MAG: type II secretion system F family protein [Vulcanimicrobiota bacterium]
MTTSQPTGHPPLNTHELHLWALQLQMMWGSGVPLVRALESLAASEQPRLASTSAILVTKISHGRRLSEAMKSLGNTFSAFVVNLVTVAENSGRLAEVLERITQQSARRETMERSLKSALAYPAFLCLVSTAMAAFMALYMFPKLLPFLTGLRVPLPWPTRLLIWASQNLASILLILTTLGVWVGAVVAASSDPRVERLREWLWFETPLLGKLNHERVYADCLADLHLMLDAGCDLVTSLKTLYLPWPGYRRRLAQCIEEVRQGTEFSEALRISGLLPENLLVQIKAGEESGQLAVNFRRLSEFFDQSINLRTSQLVTLLEPLILTVMGLLTGFVVLATFLPLYNMAVTSL